MVTRYPDDYPGRARELRVAGLSNTQIARALGDVPPSTVQDWVAGVPAPSWTARPRAKDRQRTQARLLRAEGLPYPEIAKRLSVSKGSVSLWVRDMEHPGSRLEGDLARREGHRRYFERKRAAKQRQRAEEVAVAAARIGRLSSRELQIAGTVAYWAEGSKSKPWRPADRVTFINSDENMIILFLAFLRSMGVADESLRFRVSIHESADEVAARRFWADRVGVPMDTFHRSTLKRHISKTVRKNVGTGYHGCLIIDVLRSANLYRAIEGMWRAISMEPFTLESRSRIV